MPSDNQDPTKQTSFSFPSLSFSHFLSLTNPTNQLITYVFLSNPVPGKTTLQQHTQVLGSVTLQATTFSCHSCIRSPSSVHPSYYYYRLSRNGERATPFTFFDQKTIKSSPSEFVSDVSKRNRVYKPLWVFRQLDPLKTRTRPLLVVYPNGKAKTYLKG